MIVSFLIYMPQNTQALIADQMKVKVQSHFKKVTIQPKGGEYPYPEGRMILIEKR
jgi:hypothetical protein